MSAVRRALAHGAGPNVVAILSLLILTTQAHAQSRGVYPLGMTATNSGVTPAPGFSYANQLIFYSRNEAKADDGSLQPITGTNSVLMDMNSVIWVSNKKLPGGARYSAVATLPFAKNDLTSDIHGNLSGGGGFADSYYIPLVLGRNGEHASVRILYGFLAPTGRFAAEANNNVGSGYWTHTISSGQTFSLTKNKSLTLSAFEMYELHTTQEGTGTHPGGTFDLDYSAMRTFAFTKPALQIQLGLAGYEQRQTTAHSGPLITPAQAKERYAVNALGFASNVNFLNRNFGFGLKFFEEFSNRSTFQGFSIQATGSVSF